MKPLSLRSNNCYEMHRTSRIAWDNFAGATSDMVKYAIENDYKINIEDITRINSIDTGGYSIHVNTKDGVYKYSSDCLTYESCKQLEKIVIFL